MGGERRRAYSMTEKRRDLMEELGVFVDENLYEAKVTRANMRNSKPHVEEMERDGWERVQGRRYQPIRDVILMDWRRKRPERLP